MSQEIKIGVNADTGAAQNSVGGLEDAIVDVAGAVEQLDRNTQRATRDLENLEAVAKRLQNVREILSRQLNAPISTADAQTFLNSFERMRSGRGAHSQRLRQFDGFEQWWQGHERTFRSPHRAADHRNQVLQSGLQNTDYAQGGAPAPGGPAGPPPPGSGGGGGSAWNQGLQRSQSAALAFAKGALALAGIGSIMGMAAAAIDQATDEGIGADTAKRKMGDLGVEFENLRSQARRAADGLGITYTESARLAQHYAGEVGNLRGAQVSGGRLQSTLQSAYGFSRSYGLDPSNGVQFFATMRRLGAARDEQGDRRLALLIADGIERGGFVGKADEVLQAVSDYSSTVARQALITPNVGAFMSALSSLTKTGLPGMDPAGAASLLSSADNALRRGGARGEASLNFSYQALLRRSPGLSPIDAMAMLEGGLFASSRSTFGKGTALGQYYAANGLKPPELTDESNLSKVLSLVKSTFGSDPRVMANALKEHFGVASHAQAVQLVNLDQRGELGKTEALLGRHRIDPMKLNPTSFGDLARIANADKDSIKDVYKGLFNRSDFSDADRQKMSEALKSGSLEGLKGVMAELVAARGQEKTEGEQTRESVAGLKNELAKVGGNLLRVLNPIRDGVTALSRKFARDELSQINRNRAAYENREALANNPYAQAWAKNDRDRADLMTDIDKARSAYDKARKEGLTHEQALDRVAPKPNENLRTGPFGQKWLATPGVYNRAMAIRSAIASPASTPATGGPSDAAFAALRDDSPAGSGPAPASTGAASMSTRERQAMTYFMRRGWTQAQAAGIVGNLIAESELNTGAVGDGGKARGIAQWWPDRWAKLVDWSKKNGLDPNAYGTQLAFVDHEMRQRGDDKKLAGTNSPGDAAASFGLNYERPAGAQTGVASNMHGWNKRLSNANRLFNTQVPASDQAAAANNQMTVGFQDATVNVTVNGKPAGKAPLKPFAQKPPAGGRSASAAQRRGSMASVHTLGSD